MIFTFLFLLSLLHSTVAEYTFALIPKAVDNPFFDVARDGCHDKARILGVSCLYIGPSEEDPEQQAEITKELIQNSTINGIAISVSSESLTPVINEAISAGIPVVTFDSDAPQSMRHAYIGTDNHFFGEQIAKVLMQLVPNGGTYAVLGTSAPNIVERVNGFQATIEEDGNWVQVVGSPSDFEANLTLAMEDMHSFARLNPTAIVPVMGAPMRSGTWAEFVDEHRHRNITLVSGDAAANQISFLESGYVDGLVGQLPYEMGFMAIEALYALAQGQNLSQQIIGTNVLHHIRVPLILPPLTVDHNLIGDLQYVGYILFALIGALSLAFGAWTYRSRNAHVVKISQPKFLVMVALGILVMASSLVPLSFDDGGNADCNNGFDCTATCMTVPWLGSVGFVIAFSALFAKTMRINRIFRSRQRFARVTVTEKDVMMPLVGLLSANVVVLICWTVLDPLTYEREAHMGTDGWNRVISTYGGCRSENVMPFLIPLLFINMSVLALANWQAYQARHLESELSEAKYIGFAMLSTLQALLMGIPILFVVKENPVPFYLVLTFMIFIICMATLLLIFVPKIVLADTFSRHSEREQRAMIRSSIRRSSYETSHERGLSINCSGYSNFDGESSVLDHECAESMRFRLRTSKVSSQESAPEESAAPDAVNSLRSVTANTGESASTRDIDGTEAVTSNDGPQPEAPEPLSEKVGGSQPEAPETLSEKVGTAPE